ncbi:MAG TPA: AMP-binding protein [Acidimicrobiia bacterium]|nr:AMP-binding protein [Acidimicrobiia bacterium]
MISATYEHPRAAEYARLDGPWDIASLDRLLSDHDEALAATAIATLAGGLRDNGVEPGSVVTWQAPNTPQAVTMYRACWRLGAIAAPIHHAMGLEETAALVRLLRPRAQVAWSDVPLRESRDVLDYDTLFASRSPIADRWDDPAALAAVLFTSGSSGTPKGVLHTQRSLAYKARLMAEVHGLRPDDAVLMPAPLAHISGLLNGVTLPGVVPFKTVLMARWDPEHALDLIEREQVTFMIGPPTFFVSLMAAPSFSAARVASLRLVSSGGAGVTEEFVEEASARLGCVVKRTYGSTEAPTVATSLGEDAVGDARRHDGRAIGAIALRVSDPDTGEARAPGEAGELWVQGPELFSGYLDQSDTDAAVRDGWFRTGDLATVDAQGWLTIVGRIKDVIIRGGENIAAAEVESVLERHAAISHAVAVGYPDRVMGERVCAFVVSRDAAFDVDACRSWFEEQRIARFKTPERVVVVDALPLLASGKPDRTTLRERAAQLDVT